jgi:hypothetical protein
MRITNGNRLADGITIGYTSISAVVSAEHYKFSFQLLSSKLVSPLLHYTSANPASINFDFAALEEKGLNVKTSSDGKFRIYNWNMRNGGTMQFYKSIFQYKSNGKVYSRLMNESEDDIGCSFYDLNEVSTGKNHYYITCSVAIGSTALYFYNIKTYLIQNDILSDSTGLIKTKTGFQSSIGYEVDLSATVNRNVADARENMELDYDPKTRTITFPLITMEGKITGKKIRYKFNGHYFEKIL